MYEIILKFICLCIYKTPVFSFLFKNANILQKKIILQKLHYDIFKECHSNIKECHSNRKSF